MANTESAVRQGIHHSILHWSTDLPAWQRDALRRIVETGEITSTDIDELVSLCRHGKGLEEEQVPDLRPLKAEHVPAGVATRQKVTLCAIAEPENVNALDKKQELTFAPTGLTVVFGYNGSGKSGYGRILRRTCHARKKGEPILPNVLKKNAGNPATAVITYALDDVEQPPEQWIDGQRSIDALESVSFFDADCAGVHVRERNDIAFMPFGLDVLPKLGAACKEVQQKLDAERKRIEGVKPQFLNSSHATGASRVGKLLTSLRYDTNVEEIESLASLSDQEKRRLKELPAKLVSDPQKLARELRTHAGRIENLRKKLEEAEAALSDQAIEKLKELAVDADHKSKAAEAAAKMSFADDPLPEIGETVWRELWGAARRYSAVAYPDRDFPVVDSDDAVCVLCQQPLGDEAKDRLRRFEDYVADETAKRAEQAKTALRAAIEKLEALGLQDEGLRDHMKDVGLANAESEKAVRNTLAVLLLRLRAIRRAKTSGDWNFPIPTELNGVGAELETLVESMRNEADQLERSANADERRKLEAELAELQAREWLATVLGDVKEHIHRLSKIKKLQNCIAETRTNRITAKSKELAKEHVTDQLRDAFASEIKKMEQGVRRLNVELTAAAGEFGSSYYRIRLVGAHDDNIGAIVSEGEHRCIALAGFLSELATEQSQSAIVFDDPVCSLDHQWRECFARRLVEEAGTRQVIVFTHDIVFLHDLMTGAKRRGVPIEFRHIRAERHSCGYVSNSLPWIAEKIRARIDELEKRARKARVAYEAHNNDAYEKEICNIYSDLRAAIELAVQECFFRGVVVRHRDYINLKNLKLVTAVTRDHCDRLQNLHQRCCDFTNAHDRSSLRSFGVPTPDNALADLAELRDVIDEVKAEQKALA